MTENFRKEFEKLKAVGQRGVQDPKQLRECDAALVGFLQNALADGRLTALEDIGFAYWNISDSFALLREHRQLYVNHKSFYGFLRGADEKYLLWAVADATQRLTLSVGGYEEFWWNIYDEAMRPEAKSCVPFAEFSAHKAALYCHKAVPTEKHRLNFAVKHTEHFLESTKHLPESTFYKAVLTSLFVQHKIADEKLLLGLLEQLLPGLRCPKSLRGTLPGEWAGFTAPPDPRTQSEQGIIAIINACLFADKPIAKEIYQKALFFGLTKNTYIEPRL